jgi:hypothetical protein
MAAPGIPPSGPALRRQAIMTISGGNAALLTDGILSAFQASEFVMHREKCCVQAVIVLTGLALSRTPLVNVGLTCLP